MTVLRQLARPALAALFVTGGLQALRHPKEQASLAEPLLPLAHRLGLDADAVQLARWQGALHLGAGVMLASGRMPRLAAAALAATVVPTTLSAHRFWDEEDPSIRAQQKSEFLKNVAIAGGLLLAVADTGGRPSVTWLASRLARRAGAAAGGATGAAVGALEMVERGALDAVNQAVDVVGQAVDAVSQAAGSVGGTIGGTVGGSAEKILARMPNNLLSH